MATTDTAPLVEKWSNDFRALRAPKGPEWVLDLREDAAAQFGASGLPDRKTEAWRYTPVRVLEKLNPAAAGAAHAALGNVVFPEPVSVANATVVDIGNGVLTQDLPETAAGITLLPLTKALAVYPERLRELFTGVELGGAARAFSALNTAFLEQGLVVHVAEDVTAGPILLRWAFSVEQAAQLSNFRLVLLLERGSKLELIEQFESTVETANALNVVTQADLGENSVLGHVRVQRESDGVVLLTSTSVAQAAASRYRYDGFDLGGGLVRHEIDSVLAGSGSGAELNGAFVLDRKRYTDNHISVDHASTDCSSSQFFRGVLGGSSRGVFNGRALIRKGADGSSVRQSNANLLLSPLAEMDTKPELEIYADEVEASHGATVGQLDESAVFYMRTRGLSELQARRMLTAAFCHAVTDRLGDRDLAAQISDMFDEVMPDGLTATDPASE